MDDLRAALETSVAMVAENGPACADAGATSGRPHGSTQPSKTTWDRVGRPR